MLKCRRSTLIHGNLGEETFNITAAMDIPAVSGVQKFEELTRYFAHDLSGITRDELSSTFGSVQFWYMHAGKYLLMSKEAFRVLATPPSSASSERDFRDEHRILTSARKCIASDAVFDLIQIRSHYSNQ